MRPEPFIRVRRAAICLLTGMAAILATHVLHSHSRQFPEAVRWILGVTPNFAAAYSLPFFSAVPKLFWPESRFGRLNPSRLFAFTAAATFLLLLLWEAVQYLIWHYPFDPDDILASGAGSLLSTITYLTLL
jgi:hypothetical protein